MPQAVTRLQLVRRAKQLWIATTRCGEPHEHTWTGPDEDALPAHTGYALPSGRSAALPASGTMSPASPAEGGQQTAAVLSPGRLASHSRSPADEGSGRLAAVASADGSAPMDVGAAGDAHAAESDEAVALETLAAMVRPCASICLRVRTFM